MEKNENLSLCAQCGGKCCKGCPCVMFPNDVFGDREPSAELLAEFLTKNPGFGIDWWDGDPTGGHLGSVYFVQPRVKMGKYGEGEDVAFRTSDLFHAVWSGECIFLTPQGCSLSWKQRPTGGKGLVPCAEGCHILPGTGKEDCAIAWYPYQDFFGKLDDLLPEWVNKPVILRQKKMGRTTNT